MQRVIFSKYSNDRSESFKIHTDILEDEQGVRYVRKVGMTDLAKRHLEAMHEMSGRLQEMYASSKFEVNQSQYHDGVLELEYIQGETLEDILDGYLSQQKYGEFVQLVSEYAAEMKKTAAVPFVPCDGYHEIFGREAYAASGQMAMECSNIDMIFPNLVQRDDKWTVLDYEWMFPMTVPLEFIMFRTAHYYLTPDRERMAGDVDIYDLLGVNRENCTVFQKMEENFQRFVCANNTPLWRLYDIIGKNYFFPVEVVEQKKKKEKIGWIKYNGDEYRCSVADTAPDESGQVLFDIEMDGHCDTLVITPAAAPCIVYIDKIVGISGGAQEDILYGTNGASSDNRLIYFNCDAPQILIGGIKDEMAMIHVEYKIDYANHSLMQCLERQNQLFNDLRCDNQEKDVQILKQNALLQESISEQNNLRQEYELKQNDLRQEYESKLNDLQRKYDEANQKIEAMENSTSWRVTRPMRNVMAKIRGAK